MDEVRRSDGKGKAVLYLPKRSTVLILCFVVSLFAAAQFFTLDGAMIQLLKDESTDPTHVHECSASSIRCDSAWLRVCTAVRGV